MRHRSSWRGIAPVSFVCVEALMGGGTVLALVMIGIGLSAKCMAIFLVGGGAALIGSLLVSLFLDSRWSWRERDLARQQQLALLDVDW
jgi:hypothetical protein